ncbi:Alpha/Beta hydrolase protein [Desarmillaria tabescens]|uniref:Alpha/Beta hydrolase protein n=1 Tax=Armillaria tabescens TaxID=1929756 RepID=A0AA39JLV6_ARMTA|nr:Alpha/Beta hydrolase protein [Desarmillaria tabescens]KAK0444612.1 Alpha/Beta hydrolase protein [Desarmillaria tabescens]
MPGRYIASQDGTRIWADAAGTPGKPAVIFIHGLLCSSLNWVNQFNDKRLLNNLYMIKYETRGHGRSDQPKSEEAYVSARHAEDFHAVCTAFNVTKPVVVSWSLGGLIVPDVLSRFGTSPLPVAGHVMLNAVPWRSTLPEILRPFTIAVLPSLSSPHTIKFRNGLKDFVTAFVAPDNCGMVSCEDRCAWMNNAMNMSIAARTCSLSRTQDETALLRVSKQLPILCIQATEDTMFEAERHEEIMRRNFGDNLDYRRLPGAGHSPFYELPEIVNPMILQFVQHLCCST